MINFAQVVGVATYLDQSVTKSKRPGIVRVNLPDKDMKNIESAFGKTVITTAQKEMTFIQRLETPVFDLTNATMLSSIIRHSTNSKRSMISLKYMRLQKMERRHVLIEWAKKK